MAAAPEAFLDHLRQFGYHPRSNKHSNALCELVVEDLLEGCAVLNDRAARGLVVYDLNFTVIAGTADWNVDLVLGSPVQGTPAPSPSARILRTSPSTVQIAVEIKSVMTEHRKAIRNRKRDFEAHHDHIHRYNADAIAGALLVVNMSERFQSPLRDKETHHRDPPSLARLCVDQLRAVATRSRSGDVGLDARAAIVVSFDNIDRAAVRLIGRPPAPAVGDPLHYHAFIQRVCNEYERRF